MGRYINYFNNDLWIKVCLGWRLNTNTATGQNQNNDKTTLVLLCYTDLEIHLLDYFAFKSSQKVLKTVLLQFHSHLSRKIDLIRPPTTLFLDRLLKSNITPVTGSLSQVQKPHQFQSEDERACLWANTGKQELAWGINNISVFLASVSDERRPVSLFA